MSTTLAVLLDFHSSEALLLVHNLILHAVFLLVLKAIELLLLLVLLLLDLRLFALFVP